jgi:hypothetical protein
MKTCERKIPLKSLLCKHYHNKLDAVDGESAEEEKGKKNMFQLLIFSPP